MTKLYLITYGKPDRNGYIYEKGCFPNIVEQDRIKEDEKGLFINKLI